MHFFFGTSFRDRESKHSFFPWRSLYTYFIMEAFKDISGGLFYKNSSSCLYTYNVWTCLCKCYLLIRSFSKMTYIIQIFTICLLYLCLCFFGIIDSFFFPEKKSISAYFHNYFPSWYLICFPVPASERLYRVMIKSLGSLDDCLSVYPRSSI